MQNQKNTSRLVFDTKNIISKYNLENKIETYFREILDYNKKVNIVSRETSSDDLLTIAADSLIPFEFLPPPTGKIFDIGPGAGFPSIVILLAFQNLQGLLIERTKKKTVFLRRIISILGLKAKIMSSNFVDVGSKIDSSSFDIGLMKLVRPNTKLLRGAFDLLKPTGKFVYYSDFDDSSTKIPANIEIQRYKYILDKNDRLRTITVFSRTS